MRTKHPLILIAFIAAMLAIVNWPAQTVHAHGTNITYTLENGIIILNAQFDTGEPMADAQIVVYAPTDLETPYYRGLADADGHIEFAIDPTVKGSWDISVRTGGHGEILHVPVEDGASTLINNGNAGRTQTQTLLLAVGVVVVLGGVALYFMRGKRTNAHS